MGNLGKIAKAICINNQGEVQMGKQHTPRFLSIVADAKSRIREVDVPQVQRWNEVGEQYTIIDVREESEYAAGHIPGAVHIGKGVIERDIETKVPETTTPIVLYCGGGFRSALAADAIQKMGYTNVISMDGGWSGWVKAGGEVEKA
jgi:rhodanese-related sulfurtransferase